MSVQTTLQGWREFRPSKAQALGCAVGAALLLLVIGFGPGGWVTGGKAQQMAAEAATQARTELAVAVCAEEFMGGKDAQARLSSLRSASWYERGDLVAKAGWATMPDRKEPNSAVAAQCAARLAGA